MRTVEWRGRRVPPEPAVLLAVLGVTGVAFLLGPPGILAVPVAVVVLIVPGYSLVRLARLEDRQMELLLGAVLSVSMLGLANLAGAYLRQWSPRPAIGALLVVGVLAVLVELGALRSSRVRAARLRMAKAGREMLERGQGSPAAEIGDVAASTAVVREPSPGEGVPASEPPGEPTPGERAPASEPPRAPAAPIPGIGRLRDRRPPTGSWVMPVAPIEPAPQPAPIPAPAPDLVSTPEPVPAALPVSEAAPTPGLRPQRATATPAEPQPAPVPGPRRKARPAARPTPVHAPPVGSPSAFEPEPAPAPAPEPKPKPKTKPKPAPAPAPVPPVESPSPSPSEPEPAPAPKPKTKPTPVPAPKPKSRPEPAPAPPVESKPKPTPKLDPAPGPAPTPPGEPAPLSAADAGPTSPRAAKPSGPPGVIARPFEPDPVPDAAGTREPKRGSKHARAKPDQPRPGRTTRHAKGDSPRRKGG